MFVIHADSLGSLRRAVEPLTEVSQKADIKCSADRLSIIVVPNDFRYVVSLRMAPSFFTSFGFIDVGDGYQEYASRFLLELFFQNLSSVHRRFSLTIFLREHQPLAPVKFEDPRTGYFQYSALVLSHPLNIDVGPIDFGNFVAIDSVEFMHVIAQLPALPNEIVLVTLTETQVKFSVSSGEVVLTTENRECIIGGVAIGSQIHFLISLHPDYFFFHLAFISKWVWLFKSISSRDLMSINMGSHANYVICF